MVSKTLHTFKIEKSLIKACLLQSVLLFQNLDENFQYILDAQQRFWGLGLYIIAAFHCCMHANSLRLLLFLLQHGWAQLI